jgi:hypothetical protein
MRSVLWSSAVVLSVCGAFASGMQSTDAALPAGLRTHVQDGRFGIVTSVRGLPLGVRDALQGLFGSPTLDIADTGADFQASGVVVDSLLPTRRLVAAGCSNASYCLVYYQRRGNDPTWHVALFHWTPAATRFEWGGVAPGGLATIDEVRKVILTGGIKAPAKFW